MVRVVDCHAGVLGSNPGGPKDFSLWNYFNGVGSNSVMPGAPSESSSGLYSIVCLYERLMPGSQEIKGGRV